MIGRGDAVIAPLPERVSGAPRTSVEDLTRDMREFRFRGDRPAAFRFGQYALLSLLGGVSSISRLLDVEYRQ